MKKILPILLCYVLSSSQVFALKGGPVYPSAGISVTGTYSGVLQGVTETDNSTTQGPAIPGDPLAPPSGSTTVTSNAIGLFDLTVPTTALSTGAFMLFADGEIFSGTINATADPDTGKLTGLLEATFNFNLSTSNGATVTSTPVTADAVGRLNAIIGSNTVPGGVSTARLTGTANLDINFGQVNATTLAPVVARTITFDVTGFKQT